MFELLSRDTCLRPVQVRFGPTQLHHPKRYRDVLGLGQLLNFGFIQAGVEHHGGVAHCLLILDAEQLPDAVMVVGERRRRMT